MERPRFLIVVLLLQLVLIQAVSAQVPQKLSYQFVARDSNGSLVSEGSIGMRISVMQSSPDGDAVYVETHSITTNINGAGSLEVGTGAATQGSFSHINWSQGPYFLKTEIDAGGGTGYVDAGTTQLLSVPYALYAENGFYYKIGDLAQGGIIFSLWKDSEGNEHGLVAALEDQAENETWGVMYQETEAASASNGMLNSGSLNPGTLCSDYSYTDPAGVVFDDYYLPAIWELSELSKKAFLINAVLESDDNPESEGFSSGLSSSYWSSTELSGTFAWFVQFASGISNTGFKDTSYRVRAIRRF